MWSLILFLFSGSILGEIFADFEETTWPRGWIASSDFPNNGPLTVEEANSGAVPSGFNGKRFVTTRRPGSSNPENATGTLTSPKFTIQQNFIHLLVGGGNYPDGAYVGLFVNDRRVLSETGANSAVLSERVWNVTSYVGQIAEIRIVDQTSGSYGYILCDDISFTDSQAPDGYKLVWSEEFDYEGPPDSKIWNFEKGFARNEELQWYQDGNAVVRNGTLVIEGRKERVKNPNYKAGSSDWKTNREYAEYTSSSITTSGKKQFTYGIFEIRAKIPTASGSWPAIWTLGNSYDWPSGGEIDIMEFYRSGGTPSILANFAWGTDTAWEAKWDSSVTALTHFTNKDPDWVNKFHVWRMNWDETKIQIFLDDELLNDVLLSQTVNGNIGQHTNPFKTPQYILLNLAIGKNGGTPDDKAFPLRYEVDYVRVYQK